MAKLGLYEVPNLGGGDGKINSLIPFGKLFKLRAKKGKWKREQSGKSLKEKTKENWERMGRGGCSVRFFFVSNAACVVVDNIDWMLVDRLWI